MKKIVPVLVVCIVCIWTSVTMATSNNLKQASEGKNNFTSDNPLTYVIFKDNTKHFYFYGKECGENCDEYGRNCTTGSCNALDCNRKNGYTKLTTIGVGINSALVCKNPNTLLAYSAYSKFGPNFYIDDVACGVNCNIDGTNCQSGGICNIADCNREAGYTQFIKTNNGEHYICYNPNKNLGYWNTYKKGYRYFFYNGYKCGLNCDFNGKNCEYETGSNAMTGICNIDDCPSGYTIFNGYCKKPDGKKLLYKDKDGKFKNADVRDFKYGAQMGVGYMGYILGGGFGTNK